MVRLQGSFLVRCWHVDDGEERIAIEHIQSGRKALVASLAEAVAWIATNTKGEDAPRDERSTGRPPAATESFES